MHQIHNSILNQKCSAMLHNLHMKIWPQVKYTINSVKHNDMVLTLNKSGATELNEENAIFFRLMHI